MGPSGQGWPAPADGTKQKGNLKPSDLLDEKGWLVLEEKSFSAINNHRKMSYQMMMDR